MTLNTTSLSTVFFPSPALTPRPQRLLVMTLIGLLMAGGIGLAIAQGWRQGLLFGVGGLFGLTLYHAGFGFASSYRQLFVQRQVAGVLAQILMLAIATVLFAPFLIYGGDAFRGTLAPVAVQGAIGAFLFGIGMQLGSGCACGTLYTIGGGSSMMLLTLATFSLGSFWASLTEMAWAGLPLRAPISLAASWGWLGIGFQLLLLGGAAWILWQWRPKPDPAKLTLAQEAPAASSPAAPTRPLLQHLLFGPWSLVLGAIALALLNALTMVLAGRPWGVTWGFTLWAAKIAQFLGWDPSGHIFWGQGFAANALASPVWNDVTSVMNFGLVLGASLAAALAGRLTVRTPPSRLAMVAALIGGLMMGYGARLAFGCNVGAYFSGIASTSLHGWLWIGFALLGTLVGLKLRPLFQLRN